MAAVDEVRVPVRAAVAPAAPIASNQIPTVKFVKGDVKEEIARKHFQTAEREGRYGVVMVGIAQEKRARR